VRALRGVVLALLRPDQAYSEVVPAFEGARSELVMKRRRKDVASSLRSPRHDRRTIAVTTQTSVVHTRIHAAGQPSFLSLTTYIPLVY
jgi:hypothetical protein